MISNFRNTTKNNYFFLLILVIFLFSATNVYAWKAAFKKSLRNGGALVIDDKGTIILKHRIHEQFIPASTIKIATAACAIKTLGKNFRFKTEFYLDKKRNLYVKGFGDPFLVSEEFPIIAAELKKQGLKKVNHIYLDDSYFSKNVTIDGSSQSTNPYDAVNGALIANFNTIFISKQGNHIKSAEPQTPLTPTAKRIALRLKQNGKQRINLGKNKNIGPIYFGELLKFFLEKEGVQTTGQILARTSPINKDPFYTHKSSKSLDFILKGLLKYSTNFSSNQLFLAMGAKVYGAPATVEKGLRVFREFLANEVKWKGFSVQEGAGLSRKNKVTPIHMMQLLNYFEPNSYLLPTKDKIFHAKTGTLTGVNTYAGYFKLDNGKKIKFVFLVNSPVAYGYKFQLAHKLYKALNN